ncbi:uncharacterized protein L199_006603 [Kwoniella botswanensis]|uniref:uncharacterized protein n=1 Tax=Kwoniella botswanensis TaxID=1268659 RepID=UPI00315D9AC9
MEDEKDIAKDSTPNTLENNLNHTVLDDSKISVKENIGEVLEICIPRLVVGGWDDWWSIPCHLNAHSVACTIQAFPISYAGVSRSFANVIFQIGGVVGAAIQAGLLNNGDSTLEDWTGRKNSYFFGRALIIVSELVMLTYKERKVEISMKEEV